MGFTDRDRPMTTPIRSTADASTSGFTLPDLLARAAERWPDADALVFPTQRVTFAQLEARTVSCARSLLALGVDKNDHVGILMPNCVAYVELLLACALVGAWAVPINSRYKARELAYVIENADLHALFTTDVIDEHVDFVELLGQAFPALATQHDPRRIDLRDAPRLRTVVLMGTRRPTGMLGGDVFAAAASRIDATEVAQRRAVLRSATCC